MMTRVVVLPHGAAKEVAWLMADGTGGIVASGSDAREWPLEPVAQRTVLVLPGAAVTAHWVSLPRCPPSQMSAAAARALKDRLAAPAESFHFVCGDAEADGARLVLAVERECLRAYLDRAEELGLVPDVAVPDYLMLPGPEDDGVFLADFGGVIAVRGRRLAFSAEAGLAELIIGDGARRRMIPPAALEAMFAVRCRNLPVNLLAGPFARRTAPGLGSRALWRAAVLAALVLVSPGLHWGAESLRYAAAAAALEEKAAAKARAYLGEAPGDPKLALEARLASLRASRDLLDLAAALFDAMAAHAREAEIETFSYETGAGVSATLLQASGLETGGFVRELERSGLSVKTDAGVEREGRIMWRITVRRLP